MSSSVVSQQVQTRLAGDIRSRFPVFEQRTYINSCSQGALSDRVRSAYEEYLGGLEAEGSLWHHWVEKLEQVRADVAMLLNAPAADIAITGSASASINAVASALTFEPGRDKILTTSLEFPTVGQIWRAQEARGAKVVQVQAQADHTIPVESFAAALDDSVRIVSITHVCYRNGSMLDLRPIIDLAHAHGALVLVDAYQSVGAIPLDAAALEADFIVGGMLKYLLASPGIGFLYARGATTSGLVPTQTGWFAARDIFAMDGDCYDPAPDARRFEQGTPPVPSTYAAAAGIRLMNEIGVEATRDHVAELIRMLRAGVAALGGTVVTPASGQGPMTAVASTDDNALVAALQEERVVTSCRDGNVRFSPHCYNNEQDIDTALAALRKHRHLLR